MNNRIGVLGTGANGASIAADLTKAGLDVVLIDQWPQHVEAMRKNGVQIQMPAETLQVPVRAFNLCDISTFDEKFDIVLLVLKAYDTTWACHLIEPYLKNDSRFLNTSDISERGLWLPSSVTLKNKDVNKICKHIKLFFKNCV